ncbi:beta-galactosidase [Mesorhizobium sp.]|uniref:beta-galactosidase n=1 Tax=Mesorhizobium sp. TaxID=1871066 RepID=UPI000FEA984C|nr:beta-galactosidase [Mesorhizobium sp.]RWI92615.1 MAG: beta-galactosidase [Mesorhizobium sp.]TIQ09956.1 MAG: beta-galactosidase [Mesorhizobium sp.]TIR22689.1 MAG: beta-galactosidase [Mesorhizobium sp.]
MNRKEPAPLSVWRPLNLDRFLLGAPHYPEHVDEGCWQRDAERMAAAGVNTVRMGEFAWHIFEPREGKFEFGLFDRAIELLGRAGIDTIMCTPTATPPRWLTVNYPEVLRVDMNGRASSHGSRQHADTTSPVFRAHSRRITRAMAEHYRHNPRVIGWQTDNELNTTVSESFAPSTRLEFQKYLQKAYGTIEALNFAWGGHFWATAYDDFSQIDLPRPLMPSYPSPGHVQDYHRFLAAATAAFQHDQVEILRAANPDWFIFHNLGQLADIDFRGQFGQDLDFIGFDIYPMLYDEMRRTGGHAATQALHLDICRAYSGNFIVPEQASGFGSQPGFSTMTPEPGEMRRMAMTSVARGADGVMFFRWRPAHFGAEIYWMGVIDHDDVPRRRYDEASRFFHEIAAAKEQILGTAVRMDLGIAGADFDNQEAHKTYPIGLPSPLEDATLFHRHCYQNGIACGFIHPEDDLSRLKALYVPHWVMWKDEWNEAVETFVRNGGTLILSALSATRDENNHIIREQAPGKALAALSGVRVAEFGRVVPEGGSGLFPLFRPAPMGAYAPPPLPASSAERKYLFTLGNEEFQAAHLFEVLDVAPDTEVLGIWSNRFAAGSPAITARQVGQGRVVYVGTYLTPQLTEKLVDVVLAKAGIAPLLPDLPAGVEVSVREADDRRLMFVLNTTEVAVIVPNVPKGLDLLTGKAVEGTLQLDPYGCAIIRS